MHKQPDDNNRQPEGTNETMGLQTMLAHHGEATFYGAVVPPLFMNTLFAQESFEAFRDAPQSDSGYYYSRIGNPTLKVLENKLAELEHGEAAKVFASGVAAVSLTLLHFLKQGDHVVCQYPIYGGTYEMLRNYLRKFGVSADFVDFKRLDDVRAAIKPNTKLLVCESISTFFMDIFDVPAIVQLAREHRLHTIMDNTCATPAFFRPLEWGIDVVIHSASKYIGGHSDVIAGAVISSKEIVDGIVNQELSLIGASLGPFEAWMLTRGLRTFGIRMKQHGESAMQVSRLLSSHAKVSAVNFPLMEQHPQFELAKLQLSGPSGLLSFEMHGGPETIRRFVNRLRFFKIGVSWGGFESLVYAPCMSPHHELWENTPYGPRIPNLVRLSIGLEDTADLLADLQHALDEA